MARTAVSTLDRMEKRLSRLQRTVRNQKLTIEDMQKGADRQSFGNASNYYYREDNFKPTTSEDFMQLYESYVHVYACVDAIARNCAKIPLRLYSLTASSATKDKRGDEITDGPIWNLLNQPNPFTSGYGLIYGMISFLQLTGSAYMEKVGRDPANPSQLWLLRPDWMRVKADPVKLVGGYDYTVDGKLVNFKPEEILRIKTWHPRSEFYGLSPTGPAQNSVITDLYCLKYTKQFFKQGGHLNWYLSVKDEDMGDQQFQRLEQQIKTKFSGLENAHAPAVLTNGAEIKELGASPDKNTLLPQKGLSRKEVCEAYGVPPIMLGFLDEATYNNVREQKVMFWEERIQPTIREAVETMNRDIFWPLNIECVPDYSDVSVMQPDNTNLATTSKTLVDGKIMTPNETRKKFFNMDPLEGGDQFPQAQQSSFGFQMNKQQSELPILVKILEILIDKGGMGSGHHGHYPAPGGSAGSSPALTEDKIKDIEKDLKCGQFLTAYDKLKDHGISSEQARRLIEAGQRQGDIRALMDEHGVKTKKKRDPVKREALKKAVVDHKGKLVQIAYAPIEKVTVKGFTAMAAAVNGVIGKLKKAVAVVKKDLIAEAVASLDAPTQKMAEELLELEKGKLDELIQAEFKRAKGAEPDKETLDDLNAKVGKHLDRMVKESIKHVADTAATRVEKHLTDLIEKGANVGEMTQVFQDLFIGTDREGATWAATVARTETLKYTETTRFNSLSEMGFEKKEWFHSGHENARESHVEAEKQGPIPMKEKFSNGLLYPGDPNGGPEDVINCGCTASEYVAAAEDEE